jgi:hypothetical protein
MSFISDSMAIQVLITPVLLNFKLAKWFCQCFSLFSVPCGTQLHTLCPFPYVHPLGSIINNCLPSFSKALCFLGTNPKAKPLATAEESGIFSSQVTLHKVDDQVFCSQLIRKIFPRTDFQGCWMWLQCTRWVLSPWAPHMRWLIYKQLEAFSPLLLQLLLWHFYVDRWKLWKKPWCIKAVGEWQSDLPLWAAYFCPQVLLWSILEVQCSWLWLWCEGHNGKCMQ